MTRDQERWAEAAAVHRLHGERAPLFLAEQVVVLALAGGTAGIERWQEIARHLEKLVTPGSFDQ